MLIGPVAYIAAGGAVIILGLSVALKVQTDAKQAVKAEYAAFVADVRAKGEAQERETKATIERDRKAKEKVDAENKRLRSANATLAVSLRESRSSVGYLPAPAPGAASPNRVCFDRGSLERSIAELDAGVSSLVERGDAYRIDLDSAKSWAQ